MWLSLDVNLVLIVEQEFDCFDELFVDSMEESVFHLDTGTNEEFAHLEVLVVDSHEESTPAQWVAAVDVQLISWRLLQCPFPQRASTMSHRYQKTCRV